IARGTSATAAHGRDAHPIAVASIALAAVPVAIYIALDRVRAIPRGGITGPRRVARVARGTGLRRTRTHPCRALVAGRARVVVVAGRAVGGVRVRAIPRGGITRPRHVAGIARGAGLRRGGLAAARLAGFTRGAGVAVIAGRPVG